MIKLVYGKKIELDKNDRNIVEQLQLNARQTISKIATKANLPRDVVKYRIKKLEEKGLIRQYHAFINPALLGYPFYVYVVFSLFNIDSEKETKFVDFLKANKQIIYVAKNSGKWDFSIAICAKHYADFDDVLKLIRAKFTDIIKDFEILPVIQEYKYDWMADLIEESV